jgi:nucleoside-diphosphate-sugar epimerase
MKILIIGGTGHIGMFLTPFLVESGHEVIIASSGRTSIPKTKAWSSVQVVKASYRRNDTVWQKVLNNVEAEVVIDILGTDLPTLYNVTRSTCRHLVACGSVWMFGYPKTAPTPDETQSPCQFEGYASRYAEMQNVRKQAARDSVSFTAIMPPNICGPGKIPLDTLGGRDIEVHKILSRGEEIVMPAPGNNLIGPCDAEDIARAFKLAVEQRKRADGEIFNVGSGYALTTRRFIEVYGEIYGQEIPVRWIGWQEYVETMSPGIEHYYHFMVNMCPDISKIREKLGYRPNYTPEETLRRAVQWMRDEKLLS